MKNIYKQVQGIKSLKDVQLIAKQLAVLLDEPVDEHAYLQRIKLEAKEMMDYFPKIKEIITKLQNFQSKYSSNYIHRNEYLFAWMYYATKLTSNLYSSKKKINKVDLNCFASFYKLKGLCIDIIIDDLGDTTNDSVFFQDSIMHVRRIISENVAIEKPELFFDDFRFFWTDFMKIRKYVGQNGADILDKLVELFLKIVEAAEHSFELNRAAREDELESFLQISEKINSNNSLAYKMHIVINNVIDVIFINHVYEEKLSKESIHLILELSKNLQMLGRIPNDLVTFEREFAQNDFTSEHTRNIIQTLVESYNYKSMSQIKTAFKTKNKDYNESVLISEEKLMVKYKEQVDLIYNYFRTQIVSTSLDLHIDSQSVLTRYIIGFNTHIFAKSQI